MGAIIQLFKGKGTKKKRKVIPMENKDNRRNSSIGKAEIVK